MKAIGLFSFIFVFCLTNGHSQHIDEASKIDMEKITIRFDHNEEEVTFYEVRDSSESKEYVESNGGLHDEELSKRFMSRVYRFPNGELLEIRVFGPNITRYLYRSLDDLLLCRKLSILKGPKGNRIITIYYSPEETKVIFNRQKPSLVSNMIEDTRRGFRLPDGRYIILYNNTGQSSLYNSIDDIQDLVPFDEDNFDEDAIVERSTSIYLSHDRKIPIEVFSTKNVKQLKGKVSQDNAAIIVLNDGRVAEMIDENVSLIYASINDYRDIQSRPKPTIEIGFGVNNLADAEKFLLHINKLRDSLLALIPINKTRLDKSKESLKYLDSVLNQYLIDDFLSHVLFIPVTAYVGEVFIKETGGTWEMFQDAETTGGAWYPRIKLPQGGYIDVVPLVHNELVNQKYTGEFSSEAIVVGTLLGKSLSTPQR